MFCLALEPDKPCQVMESDPEILVRQEIEQLVERLKLDDHKFISDLSEGELIKLHRSYGMWLRNQLRENQYPHLFRFCSAKVPPENLSFDAISAIAIRLIWRRLRSG
jgi:hypothetical protein